MKKFAANYIYSESGELLKNGILLAEEDGLVLDYIDTSGQLHEIAQLSFLNGILIGGFCFSRVRESTPVTDLDHRFCSLVLPELDGKEEISILKWLEICKLVPTYFPDLVITEVFKEITNILCSEGGFRKETTPGIYLLTGADLVILKLSANSRLKRIL
jgi:hypothetical protein